jgi:hypothetical protein
MNACCAPLSKLALRSALDPCYLLTSLPTPNTPARTSVGAASHRATDCAASIVPASAREGAGVPRVPQTGQLHLLLAAGRCCQLGPAVHRPRTADGGRTSGLRDSRRGRPHTRRTTVSVSIIAKPCQVFLDTVPRHNSPPACSTHRGVKGSYILGQRCMGSRSVLAAPSCAPRGPGPWCPLTLSGRVSPLVHDR